MNEIKNSLNMNLNYLITLRKHLFALTQHTTTNPLTNITTIMLTSIESNKILFVTSNQQYSFTSAKIEKHSQYEFKPPYNTMQTTHLLQHNIPP